MYYLNSFKDSVGDIDLIVHNNRLHMFHLVSPGNSTVEHLVSDDGINWKPLSTAIKVGDRGQFDDDRIWTMGVIEGDNKFYMFYTGCATAEGGRVQRTGVAVSDDLLTWEKSTENPILEADERWYETELIDKVMVSWRDPNIYYEARQYYMVVTARTRKGPFLRRGCAALAVSDDLVSWELKEPLFAPGLYYDLECPQIFKIGAYYYLFASVIEDRTQRYWVADRLTGPYREIGDNRLFPGYSHYAGKVVRFKNQIRYGCWSYFNVDGAYPEGVQAEIGSRRKYVPMFPQLKQKRDGRLQPVITDQLLEEAVSFSQQRQLNLSNQLLNNSTSKHHFNSLEVTAGQEIIASEREYQNFLLAGEFKLTGARGGFCFHLQANTAGYFVELIPQQNKVRLIKHLLTQRKTEEKWFDFQVLQENTLPDFDWGSKYKFKLVVGAGEILFCIADQVCLQTISMARQQGKVGIFAVSSDLKLVENRISEFKK